MTLILQFVFFYLNLSFSKPIDLKVGLQERPRRDECLEKYGGIEINYRVGTIQTYEFDLCSVINCEFDFRKSTSIVWLCDTMPLGPRVDPNKGLEGKTCFKYKGGPKRECTRFPPDEDLKCAGTGHALLRTGTSGEQIRPRWSNEKSIQEVSSFKRKPTSGGTNPLILKLGGVTEDTFSFDLDNPRKCGTPSRNHFYFTLATELIGEEYKGLIRVNLIRPLKSTQPREIERTEVITLSPTQSRELDMSHAHEDEMLLPPLNQNRKILNTHLHEYTYHVYNHSYVPERFPKANKSEEYPPIETGYLQRNTWVEGLLQAARKSGKDNCYFCAQARPKLMMTATAFETTVENVGERGGKRSPDYVCLLQLMSQTNPSSAPCIEWDVVYPVTGKHVVPPVFSTEFIMKVTCFVSNSRRVEKVIPVGHMGLENCYTIEDLTNYELVSSLQIERADLWWYCGGTTLRGHLPEGWMGRCALVSLAYPIQHFTMTEVEDALKIRVLKPLLVQKRSLENPMPGYFSPIYIDAIGIPRGVPDEYKLANPIANGFESIFLWITPNKNVDRINFIYYNVQRLANFTRDGFEATYEQLKATSLTAYQNRVALDMLLAEKGGVCAMFKDTCCVFIPNNTSPEGTLTKALEGLKMLSVELKENAGITNPWENWFTNYFGRWGSIVSNLVAGTIVAISIITVLTCCCIPCIRGLILRCIDKAVAPEEKAHSIDYQFIVALMEQDRDEVDENLMV